MSMPMLTVVSVLLGREFLENVDKNTLEKHVFCVKYWSKMNPIMWGGLAGSQQELCK